MRVHEWAKMVIERDGKCRECGTIDELRASGYGGDGYTICRKCYERIRGMNRPKREYKPRPRKVKVKPEKPVEKMWRVELIRRIHELENENKQLAILVKELQGE